MKHSVVLDKSRCRGCTTCVKVCPTEAIRVVRGKAVILDDKCIDCGLCIRCCPHHAKKVLSDSFDELKKYRYNVALPSAPLYSQFRNLNNIDIVLEALIKIGFDDVYEVSRAAEMLTVYHLSLGEQSELRSGIKPRIISTCPTVVRLIAMRFPELLDNLVGEIAPFELAAILARRAAVKKTGLRPEDIGICYISPCPAENTRAKNPIGFAEPVVDYVLPVDEVYLKLLAPMKTIKAPRALAKTGRVGLTWSRSGGQCSIESELEGLGADGMDSVIQILEEIEDGKMTEAQLVELDCCTSGCFGGCLTVENPFTSKMRMRRIIDRLPELAPDPDPLDESLIPWKTRPAESDAARFTGDLKETLRLQGEAGAVLKSLPRFDCGACGAPTCSAFADDVAQGHAQITDCIFNLIKKMRNNKSYEEELDEFLPPPFRRQGGGDSPGKGRTK